MPSDHETPTPTAEVVAQGESSLLKGLKAFRQGTDSAPAGGETPDSRGVDTSADDDAAAVPSDEDTAAASPAEGEEFDLDLGGEEDDDTSEQEEHAQEETDEDLVDLSTIDETAPVEGAEGEAPTFRVVVPMPNADGKKGPAGTGAYVIEGIPQEAADGMRYHIKRSAELDQVQQRVKALEPLEDVSTFLEHHPLEAMHVLDLQKPEAARSFIKQWAEIHPNELAEIVQDLDLGTLDDRTLQLAAKNADRDRKDAINAAYRETSEKTVEQRFTARAVGVVQQLEQAMDLQEAELAGFHAAAAATLRREFRARADRGESPLMTTAEIATTLQPIVQKFTTSNGTRATARGVKGRNAETDTLDTSRRMAQRASRAERQRRTTPSRRGGAPRATKIPKGTMLKDALAKLRGGEL